MKKVFFLVAFLAFFFLPVSVSGQAQSERWVCLKAEKIASHRARLTTDPSAKPLPNAETYVVVCIATSTGQICTTGNSATDNIVYKKDNVAALATAVQYRFGGFFENDGKTAAPNPTQSDASGNIGPYQWLDSTRKRHERKWMALNYWTKPSEGVPAGALGALQQGTIEFDFATADKDCLALMWDPYGRVFDSYNLEPVMGSSVSLLVKRADGSFSRMTADELPGGDLINPQITEEDGQFSFVVPDGTYKLSVTGSGYSFPVTNISQLHANYPKIYYDIYPAATGEEIVQVGEIQHRDIPVAATGTPVSNPPKMMEYFYDVKPVSQKAVIQGRVSHPFTTLTFYSVKPSATDPKTTVRYRQLKQAQADKMGTFIAEIDQSTFEPIETFGEVELTKTDLRLLTNKNKFWNKILSFFDRTIKRVEAQGIQTTTIKFDPIPTYIEGYAYDSYSKIIPNAGVGVYLKFSNKSYYQTTADQSGYYKISSEHLPTMPYELHYTNPNGNVIKTSTTQFISQNKDYLTENKTPLYVYKDEKGKVFTKESIIPTAGVTTGPTASAGTQTNNLLVMIGMLVFLLVAMVVILVVYLIKKKQSETIPPQSM